MDILVRLEEDHQRFRALVDRLDTEVLDCGHKFVESWTRSAGETCAAILKELLPAMSRHEEIERTLLFPEIVRRAPLGREILSRMEKEHAAIDQMIAGFVRELPRSAEKPTGWMILNLLRLTSLLQRHMLHEEREIFPVARKHLSPRDLERLGGRAEALGVAT